MIAMKYCFLFSTVIDIGVFGDDPKLRFVTLKNMGLPDSLLGDRKGFDTVAALLAFKSPFQFFDVEFFHFQISPGHTFGFIAVGVMQHLF